MATVTEILDRAARITGLRTTGTERQLALDALGDVYMKAIMLVQHEQRIYRHRFTDSTREYTIEKHNRKDFAALGVTKSIVWPDPTGDPDEVVLEGGNPILADVQLRDGGGVIIPQNDGADNYTVSTSAGSITRDDLLDIPDGTYTIQYIKDPSSVTIPTLRDADIQLPPNLRIINAVYQDIGNAAYPLVHVSDSELLEYRRGYTTEGFSRIYSVVGDGIIRLWPEPSVDDIVTFTFVPKPPILTEGECRPASLWDEAVWGVSVWDDARGAENVPSLIPDQFHYSVLLAGLVVQMLDKDQRMEQVTFWQGRYEAGIEEMMFWRHQYGGTPTPMFDRTRPEFAYYPDQYNRRW